MKPKRGSRFAMTGNRLVILYHAYHGLVRCRDSESSVDDLGAGQGVVLQKAFSIMRSVETRPSLGGFVLSYR